MTSSTQTSSGVILTVGVELAGVALLTLLAGASDEAGNIVVVFMLGLWLIWMVTYPKTIEGIGNVLQNVAKQSQQ